MDEKSASAVKVRTRFDGAQFSLGHRLFRLCWATAWLLLCRWTPPPLHGWRRLVLRLFGARIGRGAMIWSDARIWHPGNLVMEDYALLGRGVFCYNQGPIRIGYKAVVSWEATLCAGTHDYDDPNFQLYVRPITIEPHAWVAAQAFVGPGVIVGEGAVLGARGVAMKALDAWTVYAGNPAAPVKQRDRDAIAAARR